jgi:hypothetical protein
MHDAAMLALLDNQLSRGRVCMWGQCRLQRLEWVLCTCVQLHEVGADCARGLEETTRLRVLSYPSFHLITKPRIHFACTGVAAASCQTWCPRLPHISRACACSPLASDRACA